MAASPAEEASNEKTLWRSPKDYQRHLIKRLENQHLREQAEYLEKIIATLRDATLVIATVDNKRNAPTQIAIETEKWAVVYREDAISTAYQKEPDEESFIKQRARLGWAMTEVEIDDEIRALLRQLYQNYSKLRP